MKLLTNLATWRQWIKDEDGRFADRSHPQPTRYPCFAYMQLESWGQETQTPVYLYRHQVDEMALALLAATRQM
jgi:hypothetical protein